jgi:hypothetical protein
MKASFWATTACSCCALDRELELNRCKGFHHLGRQVWKLAEIKGLRHARLYLIQGGKPNKTNPKPTW